MPASSDASSRFPKLKECAHFHYDFVDLGSIQLSLDDENHDFHDASFSQSSVCSAILQSTTSSTNGGNRERSSWRLSDSAAGSRYYIRVSSRDKAWVVRQNYEAFCNFDRQLHRCIYDRKFSLLPELDGNFTAKNSHQELRRLLSMYLKRFSTIACNMINCGPILTWMEMDNRGNHLVASDNAAINVPAVAAAHVVKRYTARSLDELSLQVGDIVSIIDMPPANESSWWQGKCKFEVGFFPSECVQVISGIVPESVATQLPPKPVLRKRGKLISFLRSFFSSRPTRVELKQTGIVKERVFGCDLGEHLLNTSREVPLVLQVCAQAIESHGIVDGIYRLSGVASNIQKLRNAFDEDRIPELTEDLFVQDVHCISSLLKLYFRELPNPLFTYQLYDKFAFAMDNEEMRLTNIYDVVQQLPPPHYRTASYLMRHLCRVASHSSKTNMHCKNLAIVWAPNLFRSKELEQIQCNSAALSGVGIQAIITEYLIMYADVIFSEGSGNSGVSTIRHRPKSLMPLPSKLLSLEEAQERALLKSPRQKYFDVGGGPTALPQDYHTVVDLPKGKKPRKERKASLSGLKAIFSRSRSGSYRSSCSDRLSTTESQCQVRCNPLVKSSNDVVFGEATERRRRLRLAKSVDFLCNVGRTDSTCDQNSEVESRIIANPYTEDQQWPHVTKATLDAPGAERVRTKSCNSSLSDSSDLDERGTTFIKPLQSSPQNSLKRRARHSDTPFCAKTVSVSQKPFEHFGRSSYGKENCESYSNTAQNLTGKPKVSPMSSRLNIPPEVPKRSTSLYIDPFGQNTIPSGSDSFMAVSKSLATVDRCRNNEPMNLALSVPHSCSPRYSSSPSQSDHSDEVFSCGVATCESEHPLTPICEMLNTSGNDACHPAWDGSMYDAQTMFLLWMDSLCGERSPGKPADQTVSSTSTIGDTSFDVQRDSDAKQADVSCCVRDGELDDPPCDSPLDRWEVPTLLTGSAFVTEVDEFLRSQCVNSSSELFARDEDRTSELERARRSSFPLLASSPSRSRLRVSHIDLNSVSNADDVCEDASQMPDPPECFMDHSNFCATDNEISPIQERLPSFDKSVDPDSYFSDFLMSAGRTGDAGDRTDPGDVRRSFADSKHFGSANRLLIYEADFQNLITSTDSAVERHIDVDTSERRREALAAGHDYTDDVDTRRSHLPCSTSEVGSSEQLYADVSFDSRDGQRSEEFLFIGDDKSEDEAVRVASPESDSRLRRMSIGHSSAVSVESDDRIGESDVLEIEYCLPSPCENITSSGADGLEDPGCDQQTLELDFFRVEAEQNVRTYAESHLDEIQGSVLLRNFPEEFNVAPCSVDFVDRELESGVHTIRNKGYIMPVSSPVEKSLPQAMEDDRQQLWACVALTGLPPSKNIPDASVSCAEDSADVRQTGSHHSPRESFSSHKTQDSAERHDAGNANLADPLSWKSSLSLVSCIRQLCPDGYVADRSNSCSPVMMERSEPWSSVSEALPCEIVDANVDKPAITNYTTDVSTDVLSVERVLVDSNQHEDFQSTDEACMQDSSDPRFHDDSRFHDNGRFHDADSAAVVKNEPDLRSQAVWQTVDTPKPLCLSESDICSSTGKIAQYQSPVRRKSVRELKDRFESVANDNAPVRPVVKKRPPVAKKPLVVRSVNALSKGSPKCSSADVLSDSNSSDGMLVDAKNASDCVAMQWSQECLTAPIMTDNKFSFADYSLSVEGSRNLTDDAATIGRASLTASMMSEDSYASDSQTFESIQRKPRCHSKFGTSVPNVMGLSFTNKESTVDSSSSAYYVSPKSCLATEGLTLTETDGRTPSCFGSGQQFEEKKRERYFATVGYRDRKSPEPAVFLKPLVARKSKERSMDCDMQAVVSQQPSQSCSVPSRRDNKSRKSVTDTAARNSSEVDEPATSSCESLSLVGRAEDNGSRELQDVCSGASAFQNDVVLRRSRPPCTSKGPPKEPTVGRVRGLSAMFEQQSLERTECAQGRRDPSLNHRSHDTSGQNSQSWRNRNSSSSGDGEATNQTFRLEQTPSAVS